MMLKTCAKLGLEAFGGVHSPYVWLRTPGGMDSWSFFDLLLEKAAVSLEAYEQARTELAMLNADIDIVKSNIALTELRAPFDGVSVLRNVSEGA